MSRGQTSLAVKCHLRSSFSNLGCRSKILLSNVTAVKCPVVKRHWRSKVPRSNVTCSQLFLILVADQKSRGQMSLWSNVLQSNVTYGQRSHGQMSLVVKCYRGQMSCGQTSLAVKGPAVKCHLRSKVFLILVDDQKSRGQMSPWSNVLRSNVTGGQLSLAVKFS